VVLRLAFVMQTAPGWGMQNSQGPTILEHALCVVALARTVVDAVQRKDRDLASQLRRAISSIVLNTAEGFGVSAGNGRLRFETARGSLMEAQAGVRVAIAWGYVSEAAAADLSGMAAQVYDSNTGVTIGAQFTIAAPRNQSTSWKPYPDGSAAYASVSSASATVQIARVLPCSG
jgi:four helix bundle protein